VFHQSIKASRIRTIFTRSACVVAFTIVWTFSGFAAAQVPDSKEPPVDRAFNVPAPGRDGRPAADVLIPAPNQGEVPVTEPFPQRLLDRNSQALIGGPLAPSTENISVQSLQQRLQVLQAQQEQLARAYQEALMALEKASPRSAQVEMEKQRLQTQLQIMKSQVAELAARQQLPQTAPLPDNAALKIFSLRYMQPVEAGNVLSQITGGDSGTRMAFDLRTNSLLLAGSEKQLKIAEALLSRLDQPGQETEKRRAETLQLRVVWLLDGVKGMANGLAFDGKGKVTDGFVSPQVIEALSQLGIGDPRVMCQQLTTLTIRPEERRSGQFHFQVPVLVEDDLWQFSGQGSVANSAKEKYTVDIGLTVEQRDESNKRNTAELSGSIITPLAHYTVVGTTTFVATKLEPAEGGRGKIVAGRNQHLAAFVVFLDRAREFGGESGKAELPPPPK
jgi:Bacterial type II/III secretion system short domain